MNKSNIRRAEKRDLDRLLSWGRIVFEVEKEFSPLLRYSPQEAERRYSEYIDDPNCLFLIAELNDNAVGYLYAHLDQVKYLKTKKPQCELEVIYLEPKARGKGLAQDLIDKCVIWAKENNSFEVKAGIFFENNNSRKSFEKYGFSPEHITYVYKL